MKPIKPILILLLCFCGCSKKVALLPKPESPQGYIIVAGQRYAKSDFVMSDAWSTSNALKTLRVPDGWGIVCDPQSGKFAPISPGGTIIDQTPATTRDTHWEAVVAAWRVKGIWDSPILPKKSGYNWQACDP